MKIIIIIIIIIIIKQTVWNIDVWCYRGIKLLMPVRMRWWLL